MNFNRPLTLASKSPRRQQLLRDAGFNFEVRTATVEETYPETISTEEVAEYLALKKAEAVPLLRNNEVIITADTVVILDNTILGKPENRQQAVEMLSHLSGKSHSVVTGICLKSEKKTITIRDTTTVTFKTLDSEEINHYIDTYQPFDKAGSYGIQEWLGMIAITRIEGSYFNVMGLPIHQLYAELMKF